MILTPRALLGVAGQVGAREVMVVADLAPAEAREEPLGPIRVRAVAHGVSELVIDALDLVAGVQRVPGRAVVRE